MIKVERYELTYPPAVRRRVERSMIYLNGFFKDDHSLRIQQTPKFEDAVWKALRPFLYKVFNGKCAYCESLLISDRGEVDLFRPKLGAINLDKQKAPDHYWWLAYEWENLFLSCHKCNFSKASKFPVQERGAIKDPIKKLRKTEQALLLDPCVDDPDKHLAFGEGGTVSPITEQGRVTIEVLSLNRESLVEARSQEVKTLLETLALVVEAKRNVNEWLERELSPKKQYSAARRQCVLRYLREHPLQVRDRERIIKGVKEKSRYISSKKQNSLESDFQISQETSETAATSSAVGTEFLYAKTQFITRVRIKNFRNIEELDLVFPDPQEGKKPWMVLLGENGMGKSSILKAIALTLMPDDKRSAVGMPPRDCLKRGAQEGFVEVEMTGYTKPFRIDFNSRSRRFRSDSNVFHSLFFSYGGTRLLPNKKARKHKSTDGYSRVRNLFDPFRPLIDAKEWLLGLDDERFGFSARAIKELLGQDEAGTLVRVPPEKPTDIVLESTYLETADPLETLSDGYQSTIALCFDILEIMLQHYDFIEDSEGIVLIDEIDVHLHPRWKIEIVNLLRKVFPRVQFIVATHDPLCLLGTLPGEVNILRRNLETKKVEVVQHDVPPGTTAEQVLTGFWFGLRSTLDDDTLRMLNRHRELLRKEASEAAPRDEERKERNELEDTLRSRLGTFNDTSVDRMAQSVAAEVISEDLSKISYDDRVVMRKNIKSKLRQLLTEAGDRDAKV